MTHRYGNVEFPRGNYGDSSQLTNWISDFGATCQMTPEVSDSIPGSLEDTDKHIEVADGHHVTVKQKGRAKRLRNREYRVRPIIIRLIIR